MIAERFGARWPRALPLLLTILFVGAPFVACSGRTEPSPGQTATPVSSRLERAHVEVIVSGSVSFSYDKKRTPVQIVVVRAEQQALKLLSVGLSEYEAAGRDGRFRTAFDLLGVYGGPGSYSLSAGALDASAPAAPLQSSSGGAFLQYFKLKDPSGRFTPENSEGREFNQLMEPCSIEVTKGEESGSLTCPKLADLSGAVVSLKMTWQADKSVRI